MYTLLHKKIKGKPYSIHHYRGFPKLFLENQALLGFHEAKTGVECGSWVDHALGTAPAPRAPPEPAPHAARPGWIPSSLGSLTNVGPPARRRRMCSQCWSTPRRRTGVP